MTDRSSPIERLPPEVKLLVFSYLPDARTLRALALSGPVLHAFVVEHERELSSQVLQNQIPANTLRDFAFAYTSSQGIDDLWTTKWTEEDVSTMLQDYATGKTEEVLLQDCRLSTALSAAHFNDMIAELVDAMASEATKSGHNQFAPQSAPEPPPSERERARIFRAVCRFQWYCCLFGNVDARVHGRDDEAMRRVLWDKFSPWENEQLACVYQFCEKKLRVVFEDVAEREPSWTRTVAGLGGVRRSFIQGWMTIGIPRLRAVLKGDTTGLDPEETRLDQSFLAENLLDSCNPDEESAMLHELTPEELEVSVKPASIPEADDGPEQVWRWSHQNEPPTSFGSGCSFVLADAQVHLRECGYVFLECERLERWQVMAAPFEKPDARAESRARFEHENAFLERMEEKAEKLGRSYGWY